MEFHEKFQELRKEKGLTQEELAQALYVSRTAISKWESGRGYPSIDSLKEISAYFSVSIDSLLSGEKILSIAEKENHTNIRSMCNLVLGIVDVCFFLLIVLPLYPNVIDGYISSVNLFAYVGNSLWVRWIDGLVCLILVLSGAVKLLLTQLKIEKGQKLVTIFSMSLNIFVVIFLAITRETYATVVAFVLLVIKGILFIKKSGK